MDDENLEENLMRELKEETGYKGKKVINIVDPPTCYDGASKSNDCGKICFIEIDGDAEEVKFLIFSIIFGIFKLFL